jgi:hypothetical protein
VGQDQVLVCTGPYGRGPGACDPADAKQVILEVTRSWLPLEIVEVRRHGTVPTDVVVTWNDDLAPGGTQSAYRIYSNAACMADELVGASYAFWPESDAVRVRMPEELPEGEAWLRVHAGAEQNLGGATSAASGCLAVGPP